MVNTRNSKERKTGEKLIDQKSITVAEIGLETPEQRIDGMERKTTASTPMQNVEETVTKTIEFSPIRNENETTNNTPETIKDDSQTKRTLFTTKFLAMVRNKPREKD